MYSSRLLTRGCWPSCQRARRHSGDIELVPGLQPVPLVEQRLQRQPMECRLLRRAVGLEFGPLSINDTSSLVNNRDNITWVGQYSGSGPVTNGAEACLTAEFSISNLAGVDWPRTTKPMNDSITSYKFDTSGTCPQGSVP